MPIFQAGPHQAPTWCELECFEFISLTPGETRVCRKETPKEELIVCRGSLVLRLGEVEVTLMEGSKFDFNGLDAVEYTLLPYWQAPLVCRLQGRWNAITSSGVFSAQTATPPTHDTPYPYQKTTGFDNHYHDCDEYWIVFEGEATVASEGKLYEVKSGDCVATGMGWHHDVLRINSDKPLRAVWFEGTLEGRKHTGHLWEPKHGPAVPCRDRV